MSEFVATPTHQLLATLGEGPIWNEATGQLSVVDIFSHAVHFLIPSVSGLRLVDTFHTPTQVGAALPIDTGGLVSCEREGIFLITSDRQRQQVCPLPVSDAAFRCNDAKIGPDGRVWVGVMHEDAVAGAGSLWAIDPAGKTEQLLAGLTIPNGMDWWEDEFWFVDGPTPHIRCYHWGPEGLVDTGRFVTTPGVPDGLTIDADGDIWVALWGEGAVVCLGRDGTHHHTVSVPSPHTTSACLMGSTLVVTSARLGLGDSDLSRFPRAGDVFTVDVLATGRPPHTKFS
jgi:sugar lactone lactonase YvrE